MPVSRPLILREGDHGRVQEIANSGASSRDLVVRAQIVLLAAAGHSNTSIAKKLGTSRPTVISWRSRYSEYGTAVLIDHPKPGRPRVVESHAIITRLLTRPPSKFQITHWNSRLLAQHLEISKTTVQAVWKEYGIKPCGPDKFTFATVPALSASVVAVAGLHIGPQCNAIIVAVANKPSRPEQIQPIRSAVCAEQFHRYLQSRTAVLPAGKPLTTGQPFGQRPHPCNFETLTLFCLQLAQTHPDQRLHVIFDVGTGQLEAVRSALSTLPNIRTHYTSTPTIWFHLVDIWLSIVERQRRQQRQAFPKADTHEQSQASRRSRTQTSHTCRSDLPG